MSSDPADRPQPADSDQSGAESHRDPMAPPEVPCECYCLHCGRTFMSDQMWLQRVKGSRDGFDGFWMCPTPNCGGAGFTFDIFPTDPDHPANEGWHYFDDDDEGEDEELPEGYEVDIASDQPEPEYDPSEPAYQAMEEWDDEELEGEEWKLGLEPGERPKVDPPPPGVEPRNWAEQEALYDAPDRRPREIDWTDRPDPRKSDGPSSGFNEEDDIPF